MLINEHSRYLARFELTFRPQRDSGPGLELLSTSDIDVLSELQKSIGTDSSEINIRNGDKIRLTHVEISEENGCAVLLFRRRDPTAADPVFEHQKTLALRTANKLSDEAQAISAHLFISLMKRDTPHPTYRALLEEVPGIGRTYVQSVLGRALREVTYSYEDEKGRSKATYCIPELGGIPNAKVGDAVTQKEGGEVNYIELERTPNLDGLDIAGLIAKPERLKLTVKATSRRDLNLVERVVQWANANDWKKIRVQVEASGRSKVVEIAREADAADVLFVKSIFHVTDSILSNCADQTHVELTQAAGNYLAKEDGW